MVLETVLCSYLLTYMLNNILRYIAYCYVIKKIFVIILLNVVSFETSFIEKNVMNAKKKEKPSLNICHII